MNNLSVVWEEKGKVSVQERPIHQPKSDEVLIKVNACGLCGTDLHIVSGEFTGALPGRGYRERMQRNDHGNRQRGESIPGR